MKTLNIPTLTAKTQSGLTFNVALVPTQTKSHISCGALISVNGVALDCNVRSMSAPQGTYCVAEINTKAFFAALDMKPATTNSTVSVKLTTNVEALLKDVYYEFGQNLDSFHSTQKQIRDIKSQGGKVAFIANAKFVDTDELARKIGGEVYYTRENLQDMDVFEAKTGETYCAANAVENLVAAGYTVYKVDSRAGTVTVINQPIIVANSILSVSFNRAEIMRNAWTLVKTVGLSLSAALKRAWAFAKQLSPAL